MSARLARAWVAAAAVVAAAAAPAAEPDLQRLFPKQAHIRVEADGLARLVLPPQVLTACRPDLSDLRIFDASGREVAYLVDAARGPDVGVEARRGFEADVLRVSREISQPEHEPARHRETYEIAAPPEGSSLDPGQPDRWELVVSAAARRFVREVTVATPDGAPLASDSIFSLDDDVRRTRIALPPFRAERLVVTVSGQEGAYLEPTFRFESARLFDPLHQAVVALDTAARREEAGVTVLELERPGAVVPDALRLETSTGSFQRRVRVWDVQPGAPDVPLGSAVLYRIETGVAPRSYEQRSVALRAARGALLRVEIDNGDSPPLDDPVAEAVVRQPVLVFQLPAGQREAVLRFGGGRAHRVAYDLSGLGVGAHGALGGEPARAAMSLYDPEALATAQLAAIVPNPDFDASPALAFAMQPGAEIDVRLYERVRPLDIEPSAEGLSRLVLAPADVAHARPDLADVRVVDSDGRQWPYLLEREGPRREIPLRIDARAPDDGVSVYALGLPTAPLAIEHIEIETDAAYVHRGYTLRGVDADGEPFDLARGELVKDARRPRPFRLATRSQRVHGLELAVENGDDAPLAITDATATVRSPRLFLVAPAGHYSLLVGHPDAEAPRYELERVRGVVLAVASSGVATGELGPNPAFSAAARLGPGSDRVQQGVVWGVLLLTACVLIGLTLRLARQAPG